MQVRGPIGFLAGGGGDLYVIALRIDVSQLQAEILFNTFLRATVFNYNTDFH